MMIEGEELDRVPQLLSLQEIGVHVVTVEAQLPQLMHVASPYLRQQLCKLWAPVHYGQDMVQIDSDMCPQQDVSLVDVFGLRNSPVWCYSSTPPRGLLDTITAWRASLVSATESAHASLRDEWSRLVSTSRMLPMHSYMLEQHGWYVKAEIAEELVRRLDIAKLTGRFSEYQALGWFARRYFDGHYAWHDTALYGSRVISKDWVFHHTSSEPIDNVESKLVELTGGVRWPAA
jgi:hypothetical protein